MNDIRCKSCRVRLYWADKDDMGELLCWSCSQYEREMMAEEDAAVEQAIQQWQEDASEALRDENTAEMRAMIRADEHREP